MELRPGAFSQVRGNRGKRHSLSRNHGDTAEDLLFSEGWFRLRGRLKIRARGREACRASNALQKRIVDIPFRCHPATILAADRSCRSDHNSLMEWELTRRSRAAGSGGFFGPPTLHRGPDEPQYFADHRRRNPLYRKGFRCNYNFGTGTVIRTAA